MVNKIIFSKIDFGDKLWDKVTQQIQLLLESGHVCTVCDVNAGKGVISIEYTNINNLDDPIPFFLYPDEVEIINSKRYGFNETADNIEIKKDKDKDNYS